MATSCASRRTWAFAKQADHAPDGNIPAFGLLDRAQLRGSQNMAEASDLSWLENALDYLQACI